MVGTIGPFQWRYAMTACTRTLYAAVILAAMSPPAFAQTGDLDGLCDEFEAAVESEVAALGHIRIHRDPFDFEGTRLLGCIRNAGDQSLDSAQLVYNQVQTRGGGGGSTMMHFDALAPGEVGRFVTGVFRHDPERLESWGITGLRLRGLELSQGMEYIEYAFGEQLELACPILDLPESDLQRACAADAPVDPNGEVSLSQMGLVETIDGQVRLVGCVINGRDAVIGEGWGHGVEVGYSGEAHEDYQGMMYWGGSGTLEMAAPLEPGRAAMFVSGFEVDPEVARIKIQATEMAEVDGYYQSVPIGPEYSVAR